MEQPKNYLTLPAKQTKNSQVDTTSTSHVVYPRIEWHKLFLTMKVIDTNIQEVIAWLLVVLYD